MKRLSLAFLAVALLPGAAAAQQKSYDLSSYLMLKPASFRIVQERNPGNAPFARWAVAVGRLGKYLLQYSYRLDLKNNVKWLDDAEIFELTPTHLVYYGSYDFRSAKASLLNPPLRIPRKPGLPLNQPFTYTGSRGGTPIVIIVVITADQVSYTSPTKRVFKQCLRVKFISITDQEVEVSTDIMAPNQVGSVYSLYCDIDQGQPEPQRVDPGILEYLRP